MPWCPECGIEYREGFETCSDCGCALSENPVQSGTDSGSESGEPLQSESEYGSGSMYDREAFLMKAGNSIEADMLEGLLNASDIPVLKKYGEAGDYLLIYMGGVKSGVDLYVPSHLLDKAKEIIEANQGALGEAVISDEELEAQALEAQPLDGDPEEDEDQEEDSDPDGEDENPDDRDDSRDNG